MKIVLVFLLFSLTSFVAFSQSSLHNKIQNLISKNRTTDSTYIQYYDELGIHVHNSLNLGRFSLIDNESDYRIDYSPAISPTLGLGISKYGIALNLSYDFGILTQHPDKYGNTGRFIIQGAMMYKKIGWSGYLKRFKGFYQSNPEDFDMNWDGQIYPQREDIVMLGYGISHLHIFNDKKFSLNGSYNLTQKQLKSAGSFMVGARFNGLTIRGDSNIINSALVPYFDEHIVFSRLRQFSLGLHGGYSYTFVFFKDFNINLFATGGVLGTTTQLYRSDSDSYIKGQMSFRPMVAVKAAFAYVKDRFYIGLNGVINGFWINTGSETGLTYDIINSRLFVGYRIGSGKKK